MPGRCVYCRKLFEDGSLSRPGTMSSCMHCKGYIWQNGKPSAAWWCWLGQIDRYVESPAPGVVRSYRHSELNLGEGRLSARAEALATPAPGLPYLDFSQTTGFQKSCLSIITVRVRCGFTWLPTWSAGVEAAGPESIWQAIRELVREYTWRKSH